MISANIKLKVILFFIFFSCLGSLSYAQEVNEYSLEASVKIQSIHKSTQDLLQIYREIGANPQQVAVCFVFLSFLGYPNYPALVQDSNVCILIYSSPNTCKRKYVILCKLVEGSNIQKILENLGYNSETYFGWTFFTKKDDFNLVKDKQELLAFANDRAKNEIDITVKPSILSCTKLVEDKNLRDALKNINKAQFSVNVSDNQIDINSDFFYNKEGFDFADWLVKNINKPGLSTKIIQKDKTEIKANFLLERKSLSSLCNQLKEHVNKITVR